MFTIKAEKIVVRGLQKIKVLGMEALGEEDLPIEYCADSRALWLTTLLGGDILLTGAHAEHLRIGKVYPRLQFMTVLEKVYIAGDLLKRINAELALENEGWSGEVEYHI